MWKSLKRYFKSWFALDEEKLAHYYGDDKTIHTTKYLDIETDAGGEVVAVWFRCASLPFRQVTVDENRADQMRSMYYQYNGGVYPKIEAIKLTLESDERKL